MPTVNTPPTSQIFVHDHGMTERALLDLDDFEQSFLTIARHIMANFETPDDHCWMTAFVTAEQAFPPPFGATIAHAVSIIIDALRQGRSSAFGYFRADNPLAHKAVTREERYLMCVLQDLRRSKLSTAKTHALLVCEGGDAGAFLAAMERICVITGDVSDPVLQT